MSVKAVGIALKLTFSGMNQLVYPQTWVFTFIVLLCVITQMNYLNKVTTLQIKLEFLIRVVCVIMWGVLKMVTAWFVFASKVLQVHLNSAI